VAKKINFQIYKKTTQRNYRKKFPFRQVIFLDSIRFHKSPEIYVFLTIC
jgi:hypothetical protein